MTILYHVHYLAYDRVADNGKGLVSQDPGAIGDSLGHANSVRIMDPTARYRARYLVLFTASGAPLGGQGSIATQRSMFIPLDTLRGAPGYYARLQGVVP